MLVNKQLPVAIDFHSMFLYICDPLCENPAKGIFLWFAFSTKKSSFIW